MHSALRASGSVTRRAIARRAVAVRAFASTSSAAARPPSTGSGILDNTMGLFGMSEKDIAPGPPSPPSPPADAAADFDEHTFLAIPPAEDPLLHYLASELMAHGHRARANRQVSRVLLHIHAFTRAPPLPILRAAVDAAGPAVRCISLRKSLKVTYKPVALSEQQRVRYAVDWILSASDNQNGQTIEERVAREMIAVLNGTSSALQKKAEVHKFAMLNRCVRRLVMLRVILTLDQGFGDGSLSVNMSSLIHSIHTTCHHPYLVVKFVDEGGLRARPASPQVRTSRRHDPGPLYTCLLGRIAWRAHRPY
jgi:small subunit ribosomal protein S7